MARPGQIAFPWSAPEDARRDEPRLSVSAGAPAPEAAPRLEPLPQAEPPRSARSARPSRSGAAAELASPPAALPPENELWDIADAARFLKMSTSWVYKRVERGDMPCKRIHGWALRFVPADLRAWAAKQPSRRRSRAATTEP